MPARLLELVQIVGDLGTIPVYGSDELAANDAGTVDNVCFGPAAGAVQGRALLGFVAHGNEVDAIVFQKPMVGGLVGVDANAHDGYAILLKLPLHLDQRGHFFYAGCTPTCPKIEYDHLSAKLTERDSTVGILNGEVGSVLANAGGTGAAIASNQGGQ
jgi:hypothetical protein